MKPELPGYAYSQLTPELEELLAETLAHKRRDYERLEPLVHNRAVAKALAKGYTPLQIAKALDVPESAVCRAMEEMDMADWLKIEQKRIIRHLSTRNLGEEKYLALSTALGNFVEKERLLRNEPTEIISDQRRLVERIEIALSVGGGRSGPAEIREVETETLELAADEVRAAGALPGRSDYDDL